MGEAGGVACSSGHPVVVAQTGIELEREFDHAPSSQAPTLCGVMNEGGQGSVRWRRLRLGEPQEEEEDGRELPLAVEGDHCPPTGPELQDCHRYCSRDRRSMPGYQSLKRTRPGPGGIC